MITTVFTPSGIVVATASYDKFYEYLDYDESMMLSPITMEGLPHNYLFWGKFSLTFNSLNSYSAEFGILSKLDELVCKWDAIPPITEFMPYLKKLLVDNHIQIIGVVAAYDKDKELSNIPFVYQILGENIRRINLDTDGRLNYNCVYLEKTPHIGKLLQRTQIKNGDIWEENQAVKLRCDLYSIQKSIDLCRFMLRTSYYVENINSVSYDSPLKADVTIITKEKIETKLMDI